MSHKMILAIVPQDQAETVLKALVKSGYTATFSSSRGGVLRQRQQMLFIAVAVAELERVLTIIRKNCRSQVLSENVPSTSFLIPNPTPVETPSGGAIIFVWDLDRFEIY